MPPLRRRIRLSFQIPEVLHGLLEALVEVDQRLEVEGALQVRDVGEGLEDVAGAHG